jgi:GNAT superfamily N-acetyltransferase
VSLVITDALVARAVALETENLVARLGAYATRPGNPAGVVVRRFGAATACIARGIPSRFYNSVLAVGQDTLPHLDALLAHYAAHGVSPALEVVPGALTEPLGEALFARGFAMVEFHAALVGTLGPADASPPALPPGWTVAEGDFDAYLETYLATGAEGGAGPEARANLETWRGVRGWRFFVCRIDGAPAGVGVLDVQGRGALLASAATLPAARGRGVQAALLRVRIAAAAAAGCDLVVGGAYWGSPSLRNQQRAGLLTAFTRGIWGRPGVG